MASYLNRLRRGSSASAAAENGGVANGVKSKVAQSKEKGFEVVRKARPGSKGPGARGGERSRTQSYSSSNTRSTDEDDESEPEEEKEEEEEKTPRKKKGGRRGSTSSGLQDRKYGKYQGKKPTISMALDSSVPEMLDYSHIIKKTPKERTGGDEDEDALEDGELGDVKHTDDSRSRKSAKGAASSTKRKSSRPPSESESESEPGSELDARKGRSNNRKAAAAAGAGAAAGAAAAKKSRSKKDATDEDDEEPPPRRAKSKQRTDTKKQPSRPQSRNRSAAANERKKRGSRTPTRSAPGAFADDDDDDDEADSDHTARSPPMGNKDLPTSDEENDKRNNKGGLVAGLGATLAGAGAAAYTGVFGGRGEDDDDDDEGAQKANGKPAGAGRDKGAGRTKAFSRGDNGYVETETDDGEDIMAPMRRGGGGGGGGGGVTDSTISGSGSDADRRRWAKADRKGRGARQDKISTPSASRRGSVAKGAAAAGAAAAGLARGKRDEDEDEDDEGEETSEIDTEEEELAGRKKRGGGGARREKEEDADRFSMHSSAAKRDRGAKMGDPVAALTKEDRHYLNKALICLEMQREWSALSQLGELCMYGYPFRDEPVLPTSGGGIVPSFVPLIGSKKKTGGAVGEWEKPVDAPILSYLYNRFIYGFPGLRDAKRDYWTDNIQPFFDGFAQRNLSWTRERSEITKRRMLSMGFTRLLSTYFNCGITALGDESPARPSLALMREIDGLFPGRMESMYKASLGIRGRPKQGNGFNAWVAVPRQDGNEYVIVTQVLANARKPLFFVVRSWRRIGEFLDQLEDCNDKDSLALPVFPTGGAPDRLYLQRALRLVVIALSNPPKDAVGNDDLTKARGLLEKFLLEEPLKISEKTRAELMAKAERDDRTLETERKRWTKVGKHVRTLRTTWNMWRDALIGTDELDRSFNYVARYDRIEKLPQIYRDAEDWARLWVAYVIVFMLIEGPAAGELLSLLTRFHKLIPYELLKQGLRIMNPTLAIKAVVNTVLAQPMGQPSLFQRIFSLIANGDIKARNKDITRLKGELGDDHIAHILEEYVYAERQDQEATREESYEYSEDIVITILRRAGLPDHQVDEVKDWRAAYLDQKGRPGMRNEDKHAKKFELLKELLRALCLKRDREQVIEIVMEQNTPNTLKASIRVFYSAIYNIAEASDLARALGDLQAFITDLLEACHHPKQKNMVAGILKVIDKHEPSLWYFLHELARHGDLMDPLREWCRDGLGFLKKGIPARTQKSSGGVRRLGLHVEKLLRSEDPEVGHEVLEEVRAVADWTRYQKALADLRYRVDFLAKDGIELDFRDLAEELILRDKKMTEFKEKFSGAKGEGKEEDVMGWAWWAGSDVLDNPGDVQVDWLSKKKADQAAQKKQAKQKKKFFAKSKQNADEEEEKPEDISTRFMPTPPRLHATRTFLDAYLDQVSEPLFNAKAAEQERM